jgi:hypothetical protein
MGANDSGSRVITTNLFNGKIILEYRGKTIAFQGIKKSKNEKPEIKQKE